MGKSTKKKTDKRQEERLKANQVFVAMTVIGFQGSDQSFGVVQNVSEDGICVCTPQPPDKGSNVHLRISVREEVNEVQGTVRWVQPAAKGGFDVGLEFAPTDHGRMMFLKAFLEDQG